MRAFPRNLPFQRHGREFKAFPSHHCGVHTTYINGQPHGLRGPEDRPGRPAIWLSGANNLFLL